MHYMRELFFIIQPQSKFYPKSNPSKLLEDLAFKGAVMDWLSIEGVVIGEGAVIGRALIKGG